MEIIYLVQHGQALPQSLDPARPLSQTGRQETQRVAAFAARLGLEVAQIWHSGKTRAEQTAAILGQALAPQAGVIVVPGLAPKDDVRPVAAALLSQLQPVMLVGHLPFLARLAGLFLTGDPDRAVVQFCYSGIVCLTCAEGRWLVAWVLTPHMASA